MQIMINDLTCVCVCLFVCMRTSEGENKKLRQGEGQDPVLRDKQERHDVPCHWKCVICNGRIH